MSSMSNSVSSATISASAIAGASISRASVAGEDSIADVDSAASSSIGCMATTVADGFSSKLNLNSESSAAVSVI